MHLQPVHRRAVRCRSVYSLSVCSLSVRSLPGPLAALALLLGLAGCGKAPIPRELAEVQAVADPLLRANRIQTTPLRFGLELGDAAPYWAEKAGLCKASKEDQDSGDACANWAHQSPAEATSPAQRQIRRLSYLFGSAQARSYSHGLITFDRSFFLIHDSDRPALRCVIAHELSHVLRRHSYLASRAANETYANLAEEARQRALAQLSQQQELAADRGAMLMTAIAGHDPKACVQQLLSSAQLDADYAPEDPLGSHPGQARRLKAAQQYLGEPLQRDLAAWRQRQGGRQAGGESSPQWSWDPEHQVLRVQTTPSGVDR
ncbi:M48 family metalloprotease [Vulcanococcus limneticus]|uniref:M48 family metalloprotease n=1 Tax=Vulcanococcus limneticus TaxID=2170428 RepID=UPI00398BCA06